MLFFVRLGRKNDRCRRIFSTVFHFQRRNTPKFPHFNYNIVFHAPQGHFRPFSAKRSSILRIATRQAESRRYGIPWRGTVAGNDKIQNFLIRPAGTPPRRFSGSAISRGRKSAFHMCSIFHLPIGQISLRGLAVLRSGMPLCAAIDCRVGRTRPPRNDTKNGRFLAYHFCNQNNG